jgi:hypothetical protein
MRTWLAIAGLALLVAGCPAARDPAPPETKQPVTQPMVTIEPAPAEPAVVTVAPATETGSQPEALARLPETEPIDDDPAQLMALDGAALEALLGSPGLLREEPPAEVWLYQGSGCTLHVFLYPERDGAPHRVTYYEVRGGAGGGAAERRCLRGLLTARRGDAS